ncbi:hypothetical protein [Natronolimnohabitans innermongolicus]|uniref:Uncharacterized protein n=1 Tax=Natronolimnohabitans innermongolicus JCM 12255 TaxID=1227499 RepID=L9X7P9_9EURY|nr:hypothetical protein [Natronolimnohabitans innermongolicus]ELY56648.1 hypothetical protein C493_09750 [Natronolimnohabitans innermongolicus JCM 12255]
MDSNTNDTEQRTAEHDGGRETTATQAETEMTRRRTLQLSGLVGAGGLLGTVGFGSDTAAAACERPDSIVHLDYDDYDDWRDVYRRSNGSPENLTMVSSPTASGEQALQLRIADGDNWGVSTHYDFDDGLFELNGRVRFALDSGWTMDGQDLSTCRLWNCAISRGVGSAGGTETTGTNGWSNRLYVTNRGTDPDGPFHLLSNTYHVDHPGWGDHDHLLEGEEYALGAPEIEPGVWYEFEYYVCVNTITDGEANADGIVRYRLDGETVYERDNFHFTDDHADTIIDTNGPVGHYGGQYTAPQNLYAYYDGHSMALNGQFEFDSC